MKTVQLLGISSQTLCRITATSFEQRRASRKELHKWRRTGRGQTPVLFRQTISQGTILQLKLKIKKGRERERKKERETKRTKQSKQISPEQEHSTGTLDQEGKMMGKHKNREKPPKRCRCSARESETHLMLLNQNQQVHFSHLTQKWRLNS